MTAALHAETFALSLIPSMSVLSIETTLCPPLDLEMAPGQARTEMVGEQLTVQRKVPLWCRPAS